MILVSCVNRLDCAWSQLSHVTKEGQLVVVYDQHFCRVWVYVRKHICLRLGIHIYRKQRYCVVDICCLSSLVSSFYLKERTFSPRETHTELFSTRAGLYR